MVPALNSSVCESVVYRGLIKNSNVKPLSGLYCANPSEPVGSGYITAVLAFTLDAVKKLIECAFEYAQSHLRKIPEYSG